MKLAIAGYRGYNNYSEFKKTVDTWKQEHQVHIDYNC